MRSTSKLLSLALLVLLVSVSAWAQCVPYTQVSEGVFEFLIDNDGNPVLDQNGNRVAGWVHKSGSTTLNNQLLTLYRVAGGGELPVDHGWSTHGYEWTVFGVEQAGDSTFKKSTTFVAPVEKTEPPIVGDRRDAPPLVAVRYHFSYLGEGKLTEGTGAFEGAKGHAITRGPFALDLVNIPNVGTIPAIYLDPNKGGYYKFTTKGRFCGVDLQALGLQ